MEDNKVHVEGTVKRDASAVSPRASLRVMDFCLVVRDVDGAPDVFVDCFATKEAVDMLDGFVSEGERLGVDGHLTFRTYTTDNGRKRSGLVVQVEDAYEIGD